MANSKHPTSPHLQIYRLPLTALLSITHRITGVILSFGCLLLVWILAAAADSPAAYEAFVPHLSAWYGQLFLLGFVFALYLHFCNGVRHLIWDAGFEPDYWMSINTNIDPSPILVNFTDAAMAARRGRKRPISSPVGEA